MTRATRKSESPGAEPAEGWVEAWLARNKEALEASVREGLAAYERGEVDSSTMQEIIADGERRYHARHAKR